MASNRVEAFPNRNPQHDNHNNQPGDRPKVILSEEERAVLQQCNKESFWYRSMPLFFASTVGCRFLQARGIMKTPSLPRIIARDTGLFIGSLVVGRIMYAPQCKEKILQLPNSQLAETLRSGKQRPSVWMQPGAHQTDTADPNTSMEFDSRQADYHRRDRNDYTGNVMDDTAERFRPSMDNEARPFQQDPDASSQPKYNTYEDLRQQNRQDYERHRRVAPAQPASQPEQSSRYPPHQDPQPPPQSLPRYKTNKYGDVIEE